jgi:transcription elongation factor Elf1
MKIESLNDISEALVTQKYDLIVINLVSLCIAIVAVYFLARLKKSAELKEINSNFATVLQQQKDLEKETGEIKQSLNRKSISYQVKLNAYHDKTIEAITEIYVAVIQLRDSAKDLAFNQSDEDSKKFVRTVSEFRNIFDTRKIWVPRSLSNQIETVAINIDKRSHSFIIACKNIDRSMHLSEKKLNEAIDEQERFYDFIYTEISTTFDGLAEKIANEISAESA